MFRRGSNNRSKTEFNDALADLGAIYGADSGREISHTHVQVHKGDCGKAIDLLGDAICNP